MVSDIDSVRIIKDVLLHFQGALGLKPNLQKSYVYFNGAPATVRSGIINLLCFKEGSLPVKYLGIPLFSSRLKKEYCQELISKISARILNWSAKALSYAGRLQLINVVLLSMHSHWSSLFLLPICVELIQTKPTLWATWVIKYKLRKISFWGITKKVDSSWSWRQLLKIRDVFKGFFEYKLGDGCTFSFWYDPWCHGSSLVDLFPWINDSRDTICWKYDKRGFSIASACKILTQNDQKVKWARLVWAKGHVPRYSFIFWLAVQNRLLTRDKLYSWRTIDSEMCVLCNDAKEEISHFFFLMQIFSRRISLFQRKTCGKSMLSRVRKVALSTCVYMIWKARNCLVFQQKQPSFDKVFKEIQEVLVMLYSDFYNRI
ncbi:Reverse transcriptase zinc-binding domain-containing protein [Dioscorea alata]|uniref:Reverse transcriptase zinc-binding domain-containing protein n=1 Tax=Dioscorea alata TaxID=55571 RepID=A0ACB7UH09_DIOAL|nr:Reverse transcriptase zinc-binding domain-containing protein [Dioscorea alata]